MHRTRTVAAATLTTVGALAAAGVAGPAVIEVEVIASEQMMLPGTKGLFATNFNSATATPAGTLTFTGTADNGGASDGFVWNGTGVVNLNSNQPGSVTGAEARSGGTDDGNFLYSPSTDGNDSVRNLAGLVLAETNVAPLLSPQFVTFCSRPTMNAAGTGYWISGINATDPNGSTQFRVLYAYDGTTFSIVRQAGDVIPYGELDFAVNQGSGVDFDYGVSPSGNHLIQVLLMSPGTSADDGFVVVNGQAIAREGDPNGSSVGDNWDNFDAVQINDMGDYVFSGDTDGDTATDEFVAWNGAIAVRQGDTVDGVTIDGGDTIRGLAVNNAGMVCHAWGSFSGGEYVFLGEGSDLAASSVRLIGTGDTIDTTGDGVGDFLVTDLENSTIDGGQIGLDGAGNVTVQISVEPLEGGDEFEMIVRILAAAAPCIGDIDASGNVGFSDLLVLLASWGSCPQPPDPCPANLDGDGDVDFGDLLILLSAWGPCP